MAVNIYEEAKADFLSCCGDASAHGMAASHILSVAPNRVDAAQPMQEPWLGSGSADQAYQIAVREFINAYQAAIAKGANGPQLIAKLPDARLARSQLRRAGIL
jgi:hypothetical protein